jgi:hypothetical protein
MWQGAHNGAMRGAQIGVPIGDKQGVKEFQFHDSPRFPAG